MIAFHIPDMTCRACANRIGKALAHAGLTGEFQVEIDLATRHVRVPLALQVEIAQTVQRAIEGVGYTVLPASAAWAAGTGRHTGGGCCAPQRPPALDANQGEPAPTAGCCG